MWSHTISRFSISQGARSYSAHCLTGIPDSQRTSRDRTVLTCRRSQKGIRRSTSYHNYTPSQSPSQRAGERPYVSLPVLREPYKQQGESCPVLFPWSGRETVCKPPCPQGAVQAAERERAAQSSSHGVGERLHVSLPDLQGAVLPAESAEVGVGPRNHSQSYSKTDSPYYLSLESEIDSQQGPLKGQGPDTSYPVHPNRNASHFLFTTGQKCE